MIQWPLRGARRYLSSVGSHELAVLLAIVGVAAGIWAFGAIADHVMEGDTLPFDQAVLLAMRRSGDLAPIGPSALQEAARDITGLGGVAVLSLLTLTVSGFLIMDGKRRMALFRAGFRRKRYANHRISESYV